MEKLHPVIIEILKSRGIGEESHILEFLSEKPKLTYDPFLLLNMEAGVDFVLSAIEQKKKICIYGDYDADGVTSVCLLFQVLSKLTSELSYYIPSRFDEGYGLNRDAIDTIKSEGGQVIITVDCGSVSCDEVAYAKALGLEILVTDHHNINDKQADCLLINPKQKNCTYPFNHLAGCGVAFKLAQALQRKAGLPKAALTEVLDLVAIATVGDIVPLLDENRSLVKYGLNAINKGKRPGLAALAEAAGLTPGKIKADHLAYVIVPHLNAAGRMLDAKIGVRLLLARDAGEIKECTDLLISNNKERKKIQEETFQWCEQYVTENLLDERFLIVYGRDVHEGIAGIVAGKLKDRFFKPSVIVTDTACGDDGKARLKGTGRCIDGVNLYELLKNHEELFLKFGGHAGACGFTMAAENLETLRVCLNEDLARMEAENPQQFAKKMKTDGELTGSDVNLDFALQLSSLAPFGCQNEMPAFIIRNVEISLVTYMGQERQHMRFQGKCGLKPSFGCVLFNRAGDYVTIENGRKKKLVGRLDINYWNGKAKVQILIDEISEEFE